VAFLWEANNYNGMNKKPKKNIRLMRPPPEQQRWASAGEGRVVNGSKPRALVPCYE